MAVVTLTATVSSGVLLPGGVISNTFYGNGNNSDSASRLEVAGSEFSYSGRIWIRTLVVLGHTIKTLPTARQDLGVMVRLRIAGKLIARSSVSRLLVLDSATTTNGELVASFTNPFSFPIDLGELDQLLVYVPEMDESGSPTWDAEIDITYTTLTSP